MLVKDIMTTQVLTVKETVSLKEVIKLLVEIDISGLVVVDDLEEVIGVITGKDILVAFDYLQQIKAPIKDYVSNGTISVTEDTTIEEASRILSIENGKTVAESRGSVRRAIENIDGVNVVNGKVPLDDLSYTKAQDDTLSFGNSYGE